MDKDKDSEYLQFLEDAKSALSEDNIDQSPQDVEKIIQENKSAVHERLEKERAERVKENRQYILEREQFRKERAAFARDKKEFEDKKKLFEDAKFDLIDPDKVIRHTEELRELHESIGKIAVDDVPLDAFKTLTQEDREKVIDMYKELLKELDDRVKDMTVDQAYDVIQDAISKHNNQTQEMYGEVMGKSKPYFKETKQGKPSDDNFDFSAFKKRMAAYHKHIDNMRYAEEVERPEEQPLSEGLYKDGVPQGDFRAQIERIQSAREKELEDFASAESPEMQPGPVPPDAFWPSSSIYGNLTANGGMYDDGTSNKYDPPIGDGTSSKHLSNFPWR